MADILFLTHVLPYPTDSGAKIRAYYVLCYLARSHRITLLSFVRDDDQPESVNHLRALCANVHTIPMKRSRIRDVRAALSSIFSGQPIVILRDENNEMKAAIRRLVQSVHFDVIHADQTSMAQYALYARHAAKIHQGINGRPRLILDAHNALFRVPERLARHENRPLQRRLYHREAHLLRRYESETYSHFDCIVTVSESDRHTLQQCMRTHATSGRNRAVVPLTIPICVDCEEQTPIAPAPHPRDLTHIGTMFWPPNAEGVRWFLREVLPLIRFHVPDAKVKIVGKNPPPDIRQAASDHEGVQVLGYVPDPTPFLEHTAAFIVPLHAGGGMRVKIVDAWNWGVPIVSTTIGAEGLDYRDGENILIADTAASFAGAVVRLLQDDALRERLRHAGQEWVRQHYDWRQIYPKWDHVYHQVLSEEPYLSCPSQAG